MLTELRHDFGRFRAEEEGWWAIFSNPTLWVIVWYRFGRWIYHENSSKLLRIPLKLLYLPGYLFVQWVFHTRIPPSASIGAGLYMAHIGGIYIAPQAVIGENCDIGHHVTVGVSAMGRRGVPEIGNHVYIGTGATLIGKIRIGDGAKIAANTLVMTNVPPGATLMGVPGRVVMTAQAMAQS